MKAILVSVTALLGAIVLWFVFYDEPQPQVTVLPHPQYATVASAVPSALAYPRVEEVAPAETKAVARKVSPPASAADVSAKQVEGYKQSKAYRAFNDRRNRILGKFWREINKPRIEQGLEPLPEPKVDPTPEERTAMISEFRIGLRDVDEATSQQGYPSNIVDLLGDLHEAGIAPAELGTEAFKDVVRLGQAQADHQAKYVEELLERGCFGTAGYIMSMYVNKIAEVLDDPGSMGYTHLNGRITALHAMERSYARASTEKATDAVVANLARQRAKSLPGCGFG